MTSLPEVISEDVAIFTVSVAAKLAGMHPQTLRTYDRLGLVVPSRSKGSGRRYSPRDVKKLRLIQRLSQDEGINLNGIKRIIELNDELAAAQARADHLAELVQTLAARRDFESGTRVFTAGRTGDVWMGRHHFAPLLALPSAG
jgi:MerR family transcriptional regulator/heat shock protein HspR